MPGNKTHQPSAEKVPESLEPASEFVGQTPPFHGGQSYRSAPRPLTRIARSLKAGQELHVAGKSPDSRQREAFAPLPCMKFGPLRSERGLCFLFTLFALSRPYTLCRVSRLACARRPDVQEWGLI